MYKCLHGLAPAYLADYCQPTTVTAGLTCLLSANTQQLAIPRTNTGYGDRSFAVSGPSMWNSLPTVLRMSDCSLTTFRTQLKTLLFIWYIVYRQLHFLTAGHCFCSLLEEILHVTVIIIIIIICVLRVIGIKPFVCLLCNTTFTRQHSLNYHMLIHKNLNRFTCKECGRMFRHPSHYKVCCDIK